MAEKKTDNRISDREIHRQAVKNVKNANRPAPVKPRPDNRGLSDEAERRRIRAEKAENERRKRAGREAKRENRRALMSFIGRRIRLYGPTFILSLFIICIIALSLFLMSLLITKKDGSDMPPEITYTVGEKAEVIKTSAITFNGIIYTDFSSVAKMCGMSVSGDYTHLKFHTGGDEIAVFSSSSDYVVINGSQIRMEGPSKLIDGSLWVPLSFIDRYVDGISVILSDDKTSLSVLQDAITDGEVITPVTVSFLMKDERPLDGLGEGNVPEHAITLPGGSLAYVFANNLSSYYRYMNPTDTEKYLKLINPSVRDDGTFVPDDLTNVLNVQSGKTGVQIDYGAEKSLEALFIEMYSAGLRNFYVS